MIGQVIAKDYQLYVKFEDGVVAFLSDFYENNCVGVWRDFEYDEVCDNEPRVYNSKTAPYSTKDRVRQYNYIGETRSMAEKHAFEYTHSVKMSAIEKWKTDNGYPIERNCNPVLRDRILKIRKIRSKIKQYA